MSGGLSTPPVRYIDNITILANLNEQEVRLPRRVNAYMGNDVYEPMDITWYHDNSIVSSSQDLDTGTEGEFIFMGRVSGYVHDVFLTLQVGRADYNPPSVFPQSIDQFGMPIKDIQTADIETLDDYQYFKSKKPRSLMEEMHLKSLSETLADKIILARHVNHLRNAVIELEKFTLELEEELGRINSKLEDHENRIAILEEETVVDGKNIGTGHEIFNRKENRILEFRTLTARKPLEYNLLGETIEISLDIELLADMLGLNDDDDDGEKETGCGKIVKGASFNVCQGDGDITTRLGDGFLAFTPYFNHQLVQIQSDSGSADPFHWSLLGVYGSGRVGGNFVTAVRTLKSAHHYIIEMKLENGYAGMIIGADTPASAGGGSVSLSNGGKFYKDSSSRIQANLYGGMNAYSTDSQA